MSPAGQYNRKLAHYRARDQKSTGHKTESFELDGYQPLTIDDMKVGNTPLVDNIMNCVKNDPGYWGDLIVKKQSETSKDSKHTDVYNEWIEDKKQKLAAKLANKEIGLAKKQPIGKSYWSTRTPEQLKEIRRLNHEYYLAHKKTGGND
jgi:hypothetical protein